MAKILPLFLIILLIGYGGYNFFNQKSQNLENINQSLQQEKSKLQESLETANQNYNTLQSNYEIAAQNFSSASAEITELKSKIKIQNEKLTTVSIAPIPAPVNNTPPSSGYGRQTVKTDSGDFIVDLVTGNLDSTKVIIDTASDDNCSNNCPTKPLAEFVSRSGAYAGVNGTYFCPAEYPSCSGKTGSFDLLVMNKNKKYFNSDNNVYSTNPVVACYGSTCRFMERASDWGRSTDVDGVISNFPILLLDNNIKFTGNGDAKMNNKSNRSFLAGSDGKVYIGVVYNCTVAESAKTMKALGFKNALNLDSGGSTAFWFNGYKTGPGRNIPNAVLFVRK